jgi:hypothetical protein
MYSIRIKQEIKITKINEVQKVSNGESNLSGAD